MLTTMERYLLRIRRRLHRWLLDPVLQSALTLTAWGSGGFFLSAAALHGGYQPLALGLVTALAGWQAPAAALGAAAGYGVFWGKDGLQGMVWTAAGCLLALLPGKEKAAEKYPLLLPALTGVLTAVTGLIFLFFHQSPPFPLFFLRVCLAPVSALLFCRARECRDSVTSWICLGVGVLALAQAGPLGYAAVGLVSVWCSFPAAVMAGLGMELAGATQVPMAVVVCGAWMGRMLPFREKWMRFAMPGIACLAVMALSGIWDPSPLPGLVLGGWAGWLLPPRPESVHRHGELGVAQVRLEMAAGIMARTQRLLLEVAVPAIDADALLNRAVNRACGSCPTRENCMERCRLGPEYLENPLAFACRRPWEIQGELLRAQERLRDLKADRQRQREYRSALIQQYQFLSVYLQRLSDQLPRRGERLHAAYRLEISARSRGRERANGDRCLAFPGTGCRYYVLLCDGMGTGLGAAQEGCESGELLRQMLTAGFPPEHAFRSVNSLLALRGQAGAVTLDLAEIRLDSGRVVLYKWGAAASFLLGPKGAEKIGTATPPPGISVTDARETVIRLSLRRGELLILVSDGAEIGESLRREAFGPWPPGELAERLLKECRAAGEDDATVAVLRLSPRRLST